MFIIFNLKKYWGKLWCFLSAAIIVSYSQIDSRFKSILDSAMTLGNLTMEDMWLPPDLLPIDSFRLHWVSPIFEEPFKTQDLTEKLNGIYQKGNVDLSLLDSLLYRVPGKRAGKAKQTFSNIKDYNSLKKVIVPWVETRSRQLDSLRSGKNSELFKWIIKHTDSMITPDNKYEDYSVFQIKESEEREKEFTKSFLKKAQDIPVDEIRVLGFQIFHEIQELISTTDWKSIRFPEKPEVINTKLGKIILGGIGDDVYHESVLLLIDPRGNDRYVEKEKNIFQSFSEFFSIKIDLVGADIYTGEKFSCGGSVAGLSMIWDADGDDRYLGKDFSIGSGLYGTGIIRDVKGNDLYSGNSYSVASGIFGNGIIIDDEGMDQYTGHAYSQGFGMPRGSGILFDGKGNDHYLTASPFQDFLRYDDHFISFSQGAGLGFRPYASGGIGALIDREGNDNYVSDIFGQGTSYWFALGTLYDEQGNDSYSAHQYAQGAGIHFAHGLLWDREGVDRYLSHGVSQGCGHDVAFGLLVDEGGDDSYQAYGLSQGGGNADAISVFYDGAGSDIYIGRTLGNMMGYSDFRRDYSMIGLFIDAGGKDIYGDTARNSEIHTKSTLGLFVDMEWQDAKQEELSKRKPDAVRQKFRLTSTVDSLFMQASTAPEKYRNQVQPARDEIIKTAEKKGTMDYMFYKLATESPREKHALKHIMMGIYKENPELIVKRLPDSLSSKEKRTRNMAAVVCGKGKVVECIPALTKRLKEKTWQERYSAAFALAQIGDKKSEQQFELMLKDSHAYIKMRGAFGLGKVVEKKKWTDGALEVMKHKEQVVRTGYVQGSLQRKDTLTFNDVLPAIKKAKDKGMKSLVTLIPGLKWDEKNEASLKNVFPKLNTETQRFIRYAVEGVQNESRKMVLRKAIKMK